MKQDVFEIEEILLDGKVAITTGNGDPSVLLLDYPKGSLHLGSAGVLSLKQGDDVHEWRSFQLSTIRGVELDFGTTPTIRKYFTVENPEVTHTSMILMQQSFAAPTGKAQDENEMDSFIIKAIAGIGAFTVYAESLHGPVVGPFKFNYQFS